MKRFMMSGVAMICSALGAGCDAQETTTYEGEPIAVLRGTVTTMSASEGAATGVKAAILWQTPTAERGMSNAQPRTREYTYQLAGFATPVAGAFPASFAMKILTPPPAAALQGFGTTIDPAADWKAECTWEHRCAGGGTPIDNTQPREVAFGYIVALRPDADLEAIETADIVGASLDALVYYNAHDLAPGGNAQRYLSELGGGGAFAASAGYHLLGVKLPDAANRVVYWQKFAGSVCQKVAPLPWEAAAWPAWTLEAYEYTYQECLHAVTNATTCVITSALDESIPLPEPYDSESFACASAVGDSVGIDTLSRPLPEGASRTTWSSPLSATITITLGSKPWAIDGYRDFVIPPQAAP